MTVVLQATSLHKSFSGQSVLSDLNLTVASGALLGLIGRNGAGKSTFLEIAAGLQRADSGQVELFGLPPEQVHDAALEQFVYVPQNRFPFPALSPLVYLDFVGSHYPSYRRDLARVLMRRLEVPERGPMSDLSLGIRQRIEAIRALSLQPKLMLLDEPVSAIDVLGRRQITGELLNAAQKQGTAVILTTHLLADIEHLSVEVAILNRGRISQRATVRELKERYLKLESNDSDRPSFLRKAAFVQALPEGGWWALMLRDKAPAELPVAIRCSEPTLEDLFLDATL